MSDERYELEVVVDASQSVSALHRVEQAEAGIAAAAQKATAALQAQSAAGVAAANKLATAQQNTAKRAIGVDPVGYRRLNASTAEQIRLEEQRLAGLDRITRAQNSYANEATRLGGVYGQDTRALQASVLAQKQSAAAQRALVAEENKHYQSLSNTRYALYDAAQAYMVLGGAMSAPAVAAIAFNVKFDKAFSSVRRTTLATGEDLESLRSDLVDLTTEIPTTFAAITNIGTIGAQLDVANEDLAKFTEVVSMFSATTNVSVDEAATGLGRLAQLTHTAGTDYENLGSAIYQVGVTSVATEQEILNMASEIATSGDLAGLANYQIIALAGTLSSLGVQPEAARGSLMRIFNVITTGAENGGKSLQELAKISGMTADQFKRTWESDSQTALSAFVRGLSEMQREGVNTNKTLKDLGISAVRDIRTLQVLANNTNVYTRALQESNTAYESGSALRDGFAIQTKNLADQLTLLWNTLAAAADAVGREYGPALEVAANAAKSLAAMLKAVVENPVGRFIVAAAVAFVGAAGAALAFEGIMLLIKASVAAATTAMLGLRTNAEVLSGGLRTLTGNFLALARGEEMVTASTYQAARSLDVVAGGAYKAKYALESTATAARSAGLGIRLLKGILATTVVGAALVALPEIINAIGYAFSSNASKAEAFFGTFDALDEAIKEDTKTYRETGKAINVITKEIEVAGKATPDWARELASATDNQKLLGDSTAEATKRIQEQTIAIGESTKQSFAEDISNNADFQKAWAASRTSLQSIGFDLGTYLNESMKGTGEAYISQFRAKVELLKKAAVTALPAVSDQAEYDRISAEVAGYDVVLTNLSNASALLNEKTTALAQKQMLLNDLHIAGSDAAKDNAAGLEAELGAMTKLLETSSSGVSSTLTLNKALASLADSLAENGTSFSVYSKAGQANLTALQATLKDFAEDAGDDTETFGANVAGIVESLQKGGVEISGDLDYLMDILSATFSEKWGVTVDTAAARQDLAAFIQATVAALQQRLLLARQTLAGTSVVGNYAAYNAAVLAVAKAERDLASARSVQSSANKTAKNSTSALSAAQKEQAASSNKANKAAKNLTKTVRTMSDYVSDLKTVVSNAFDIRFGLDQAKRGLAEMQAEIAKSMVSLETYGDALSDRLDAAFSVSNADDDISSKIESIRDTFEDAARDIQSAAQKILDAQADLSANTASKKLAEYQLGVAIQYGDELRAAALRAKLAALDADRANITNNLVDAQNELNAAQEASNKTLVGSSAAAVANRKAVQELLTEYIDYIKAIQSSGANQSSINSAIEMARSSFMDAGISLGFDTGDLDDYAAILSPVTQAQLDQTDSSKSAAEQMEDLTEKWQDYILELVNSGASQKVVNQAIKNAKADLQATATQLGMNATETKKYVSAINDLKKAIDRIPKKLTVSASTDPAKRAIAEFLASKSVSKLQSGISVPIKASVDDKSLAHAAKGQELMANLAIAVMKTATAAASGKIAESLKWAKKAAELQEKLSSGSYQGGGYTGRGAANQAAGIVHKGEFVVPKHMVNQNTGLPYADALGRILRGYQGGGYVTAPSSVSRGSDVRVVELSPTDRALLARAGAATLVVDGRVLATTVNKANQNSALRGQG